MDGMVVSIFFAFFLEVDVKGPFLKVPQQLQLVNVRDEEVLQEVASKLNLKQQENVKFGQRSQMKTQVQVDDQQHHKSDPTIEKTAVLLLNRREIYHTGI
jgi:phosphopantothenoylcysteine synthetase/decarboxylase